METRNDIIDAAQLPTYQPPPTSPSSGGHWLKKTLILAAITSVVIAGVAIYFILSRQEPNSKQSPFSTTTQKQTPVKGCGNNLCEEGETFESCPSDCNLPSSIEPYIATTSLSVADFPPPPKDTQWPTPRDTHWSKFLDNYTITVEGGYLSPAFNNFELLHGKQTAIRLAEYDGSLEPALDSMARIDQYVLVYSPKNIEKVFAATTKSTLTPASAGLTSQDLPDPSIGDKSKAFAIYFSDNKRRYVVVFIKKAYFEMIMLSGTTYEYAVLEDIARKAAAKIQ